MGFEQEQSNDSLDMGGKLEYLNVILIDSSVVCHFMACAVNIRGKLLCSLCTDTCSGFSETGTLVFNSLTNFVAPGKSVKPCTSVFSR